MNYVLQFFWSLVQRYENNNMLFYTLDFLPVVVSAVKSMVKVNQVYI